MKSSELIYHLEDFSKDWQILQTTWFIMTEDSLITSPYNNYSTSTNYGMSYRVWVDPVLKLDKKMNCYF